jgi:hypothetical protein
MLSLSFSFSVVFSILRSCLFSAQDVLLQFRISSRSLDFVKVTDSGGTNGECTSPSSKTLAADQYSMLVLPWLFRTVSMGDLPTTRMLSFEDLSLTYPF